ncbi:MAG: hypothetical protein RLY71_1051 [Pseudomonadota bacterium]|jgi:uncharacterized heparinase superfamily protein
MALMSPRTLGRLWRTVRHLRAEQVFGRLWFRLYRPRPDLRAAPPLRASDPTAWVLPARREPSLVGPWRLRFLAVEHQLGAGPAAWDDPALERLWRYNLHYFDDLNAVDSASRRAGQLALLDRWLSDNPPGRGSGWEPYPTSLRVVNLIKWFMAGAPAQPQVLASLAVQVRWLSGRPERHLLGNHLFVNAKALVMAGLYFDGPEAGTWLDLGLDLLERELAEQILPDGGQFELSPMYHALALEDLLDLINLTATHAPAHSRAHAFCARLREFAPRMLYWLRCMSHADGRIALFNDAADGIAPPNAELERYAAALGVHAELPAEGLIHLGDSGYVRAHCAPALLLTDVGRIGPDYLVGHAHADTLSFELSLGTQRVVVNGGTSCYGLSAERLRERGTAAHSTVEVDGQDSSEVWSGFRVGRRARPVGLEVQAGVHEQRVACGHDGYRYLSGAPQHDRSWTLTPGRLCVDDRLAPGTLSAVARYPLAPGLSCRADDVGAQSWSVWAQGELVARVEVTAGQGRVVSSRHAPRFGVSLPTETLEVTLQDGKAATCWSWNSDAHPLSH